MVELYPRTGRTHQLRVHLKSLGFPIKGDWLYTGSDARPPQGEFPTLNLHARSSTLPLPFNDFSAAACAVAIAACACQSSPEYSARCATPASRPSRA